MIELLCAGATAGARAELTRGYSSDTLLVTPDIVTARALQQELAADGNAGTTSYADLVVDFEELLQRTVKGAPEWPTVVASDNICRAVLRNIIESSPADFDYLVGRNSVARMSQGVISRIVAAVESLQNQVQTEEAPAAADSPRWRQVKLLAQRFDARLQQAGIPREKVAIWQGLIDLTQEVWGAAFPGVTRVAFLDFTGFQDEVYLAIAAISKKVENCRVLLNYNPENDTHGGSGLDAAYQRLYEMSDRVITDADGACAPPAAAPLIVDVSAVSEEISSAARAIERLQLNDASPQRTVIALPNARNYAARVEKALDANALRWRWMDPETISEAAELLLLDRLRSCAGRGVAGAAVADLFRAPGFAALLDSEVTTVEAWDLASRLNYVLTLTGQVTGWSTILKQVRATIKTLHGQRQKSRHWSEEEQVLDARLLQLLDNTAKAVKAFSGEESVSEWASKCEALLAKYAAADTATGIGHDLREKRSATLRDVLGTMRNTAAAVSPGPVTFGYFTALFRTAIHGLQIQPDLPSSADEVLLCSPEIAAGLTGARCLILGFNDGNFPRFARPDASFLGQDVHRDQRPARARQWMMLERLFRRFGAVQLWMPEREGTEELLPSQFAEALDRQQQARRISADAFLRDLDARGRSLRDVAEEEFAAALRGVQLSDQELTKFRKAGQDAYQAARGITVLAARDNPELSVYDGILTDPRLKAWLAAWVDRHNFSVSQLDGIVGCSFRFFVQRMLNLDEIEEADDLLPAHVFGSFAHDVLARFYRTWVADGRGTLTSEDEALAREELLRAYHAEYDPGDDLSDFARDLMKLKLFGALGPQRFGEPDPPLEEVSDVGVFGKFLLMEMQRGDIPALGFLHPSNFEVGFGVAPADEEDPLSTPDCVVMDVGGGNKVKLWGRIDRIDVSDAGIFAVTDYKTGHLPTGTEIAGGFRTQLPVYMLVAQELLQKKYERPEAAGGLYYSLKRGKAARISGVFVRAAYQQQLGVSGRCMKDEQFLDTLDMVKGRIRHSMNALRRGYLTTTHHNPDTVCRYCSFQKLCYRDVDRTEAFWQRMEEAQNAEESLAGSGDAPAD